MPPQIWGELDLLPPKLGGWGVRLVALYFMQMRTAIYHFAFIRSPCFERLTVIF
jgi:hypothetical protein